MASGNKVTLTFAGDSQDLERSFDRVGSGARDMGRKVDDSTSKIDKLGEAGGTTETRFLGLGAAFSGVGTLLSGDLNAETAAMAMADLGDAVEHTIAPLLSQGRALLASGRAAVVGAAQHVASAAKVVAGWVVMGVQATINAAKMAVAWLVSLGPIGLVIAAVGAVIAILVALGVGFDDIKRWAQAAWDFVLGAIKSVWNWVKDNWPLLLAIITGPIGLAVLAITRNWQSIKDGFTAVRDWISARVEDIVSFIVGIPGRIASAAASIGSTIINGIKSGITGVGGFVSDIGSAIKGAINSALHLPFTIHGPGPLPDFTIPAFHTGGTFHAPAGQREGLAMLLDGEQVLRPGQSAGGGTIELHSHIYLDGRQIMESVRKITRVEHGGDVQAALGFSR